MAKNPLGTLWPSKTLALREPRLAQPGSEVPKIPKAAKPKSMKPPKMVGLAKLAKPAAPFKRFGTL